METNKEKITKKKEEEKLASSFMFLTQPFLNNFFLLILAISLPLCCLHHSALQHGNM